MYIYKYILYIYIYKFYTDFFLCPRNVKTTNVIVRIVIVIVINSGKTYNYNPYNHTRSLRLLRRISFGK